MRSRRPTSESACLFGPGATNLHGCLVREPGDERTDALPLRRKQRFLHGISALSEPFENNFQRERSHLLPIVDDFLKGPHGTLVTGLVASTVDLFETAGAATPAGDWVSILVGEGGDCVISCRMDVEVELFDFLSAPVRVWIQLGGKGKLEGGQRWSVIRSSGGKPSDKAGCAAGRGKY